MQSPIAILPDTTHSSALTTASEIASQRLQNIQDKDDGRPMSDLNCAPQSTIPVIPAQRWNPSIDFEKLPATQKRDGMVLGKCMSSDAVRLIIKQCMLSKKNATDDYSQYMLAAGWTICRNRKSTDVVNHHRISHRWRHRTCTPVSYLCQRPFDGHDARCSFARSSYHGLWAWFKGSRGQRAGMSELVGRDPGGCGTCLGYTAKARGDCRNSLVCLDTEGEVIALIFFSAHSPCSSKSQFF
ncbi:hypothetical protein BD410DRAFT_795804 [Rickenella mellea]|uniref:Uncharacterized protein n=1 Tax=Rickenella mellea TaxID=50990 RepID=A0A4Y7PLY0_9AGAM|nr:hypothetical protein BD410DRAFT_795804 [Rickenella mellea]